MPRASPDSKKITRKLRVEKACYTIIYRGKKFLLLKPAYARNWNSPGGRMEKGETEEQTARREVYEETGLKNIVYIPKFRHVNRYTMFRGKEPVERRVLFFLAESKSGEVTLSHEHTDFEWLGFEDSINRIRFPTLKNILTMAAKRLDPSFTPILRKEPEGKRANYKTENTK